MVTSVNADYANNAILRQPVLGKTRKGDKLCTDSLQPHDTRADALC